MMSDVDHMVSQYLGIPPITGGKEVEMRECEFPPAESWCECNPCTEERMDKTKEEQRAQQEASKMRVRQLTDR